jgi:hypothetical protein
MTIDTNLAIAIGGVILTMMGWMVVKIIQLYEKKLIEAVLVATKAEEKIKDLETKLVAAVLVATKAEKKADELEIKLESSCQICRAQQDAEHKLLHIRITDESKTRIADLKTLEKDMNDIAITSAGIGATYATREELSKSLENIRAELKERGGRP